MKIKYYLKMAWTDIRNLKDVYLPYAAMLSICFCFLYILAYLRLHGNFKSLTIGVTLTGEIILVGCIILSVLIVILCWTFSLTIRRQISRQQGLYRVLGLTRKNLLILNVYEMLLITLISMVLGLFLCLVFGKLLIMIAERFANQTLIQGLQINVRLLFYISGFFLSITLLLILRDSAYIMAHNPLHMLRNEKLQEQPNAKWLTTLAGLLFVGGGYAISLSVNDVSKDLEKIVVAIILVIIGTYCLFKGTGIMLLKFLQKHDKFYYHKKHMITLSNLLFRLRGYATSLASITILLTMLILTASMSISLYIGTEDSVKQRFPDYKFNISGLNSDDELTGLLNKHHLKIAEQIKIPVVHGGIQIVVRKQTLWIGKVNETIQANDKTPTLTAITLAGYNDATKSHEKLQNDEVLLINREPYAVDDMKIRMQNHDGSISIKHMKVKKAQKTIPSLMSDFVLIVPDQLGYTYMDYLFGEYVHEIPEYNSVLNIQRNMNLIGSGEDQTAFSMELQNNEKISCEDYYTVLNETKGAYGSFLFLGVLFSIIFIFAIFMILYYRMHDDLREHEHQYGILYRIGLTKKELCQEFARENKWMILTPPVLAIIHCIVAYPAFHLFSDLFGFGKSGFNFMLMSEGCIVVLVVFVVYQVLLQVIVKQKIMSRNM